jgi:hypothetical protein
VGLFQRFDPAIAVGSVSQNKKRKGIFQETPISVLLSNIYMIEFDQLMCRRMTSIGGDYYRYCDDMLYIVPTEKHGEHYNEVDFWEKLWKGVKSPFDTSNLTWYHSAP